MTARANKHYTHFALIKTTGLVVNGWDYRGYDNAELREFKKDYFDIDIRDMQIDPKITIIVTAKRLLKAGFDPYDFKNWNKDNSVFTL